MIGALVSMVAVGAIAPMKFANHLLENPLNFQPYAPQIRRQMSLGTYLSYEKSILGWIGPAAGQVL